MISMKKLGMPTCEETSMLISEGLDRRLSRFERFKIALHVAMCWYCTRFGRQLRVIRGVVERDKHGTPPAA